MSHAVHEERKTHADRPRTVARSAAQAPSPRSYLPFWRADAVERIGLIKRGVLASDAKVFISFVSGNQREAMRALNISPATLNRKVKGEERLPAAESERVLGVARLAGQVEAMIAESGDAGSGTPAAFDATAWLSRWLGEPLPALGGLRPRDLLDTIEGQTLVSANLARIQSGAYA